MHVLAVSISKEQVNFAKSNDLEPNELDFLRIPGLGSTEQGSFEFRFQDYRDFEEGETFDRIVSVGMFEHVGPKWVNFEEIILIFISVQLKQNSDFLFPQQLQRIFPDLSKMPDGRWHSPSAHHWIWSYCHTTSGGLDKQVSRYSSYC